MVDITAYRHRVTLEALRIQVVLRNINVAQITSAQSLASIPNNKRFTIISGVVSCDSLSFGISVVKQRALAQQESVEGACQPPGTWHHEGVCGMRSDARNL